MKSDMTKAQVGLDPREEVLSIIEAGRDSSRMSRVNAILDSPRSKELVQALSPSEYYFLSREIGHSDCVELLSLASDAQLGRIVDFALWKGAEFSVKRFSAWVALAFQAGGEVGARFIANMDPELIVLHLLKQAEVIEYDGTPEQMDMLGDEDFITTPDNRFFLVPKEDTYAWGDVKTLVDHMYALDFDDVRQLLKAAIWEAPSPLEEDAYRFRTGRMEDEGFPPYEEALTVYQSLDVKALKDRVRGPADARNPEKGEEALWSLLHQKNSRNPSFLSGVLEGLEPSSVREGLARSLVYLTNEVMMADSKGDLEGAPEAGDTAMKVHGLVSIALEHLAGGDLDKARTILVQVEVRDLFRAGFTLTLAMKQKAIRVLRKAGRAVGMNLISDPPFGALLEGLIAPVPRYFTGLDQEQQLEHRDFLSFEELRKTQAGVTLAELILDFVLERLDVSPEELAESLPESELSHVSCATLITTAIFNSLLERDLLTPIDEDSFADVLEHVFTWDPRARTYSIKQELVADLEKSLVSEEPPVRNFIHFSLNKALVAIERIPPGATPDMKLLSSLFLV